MIGMFNKVFAASGTLNFFGNGWPYHRLYRLMFGKRFDFTDSTFISKTTTLSYRIGNMLLNEDLQPTRLFPACIKANFVEGVVLNSVGLSGPGAERLFQQGQWQRRRVPFFISWTSLANTLDEKLAEARMFKAILESEMSCCFAPFGLQINGSCPNTGHSTMEMTKHSLALLEVFEDMDIPLDLKVGVVDAIAAGVEFIKEVENSGLCYYLTCSNTIPWGKLPDRIDWKKQFGSNESPLDHLGGGGLSGKPLKPIVLDWVYDMRQAGISIPIKAGGGILASGDVELYKIAGANAIEIGCVSILRPWRVQSIIKTGNEIL